MQYRCLDKEQGKYLLLLKPQANFKKGKLELFLAGEQSEVKAPILQAKSSQIKDIQTTQNIIRFVNLVGNKDILLEVEIAYKEYCALEVKLLEI